MKTTKPFSTISYNSRTFLEGVLKRLEKAELISFWCYIEHQPEEDENKSHFHVYMEPCKQVDLLWIRKQFDEVDIQRPDKPRRCLPMEKSKWVDWYWYGLHDRAYLASKNQARKYHYQPIEMCSNDEDLFDEKVRTNPKPQAELLKVIEMAKQGYTALEIFTALNVPLSKLNYTMQGIKTLQELTYRNGRDNHEELDNGKD